MQIYLIDKPSSYSRDSTVEEAKVASHVSQSA